MKHKLISALSVFTAIMINISAAQTTIYSETFTGGLPAGWQKNDLSGTGAGNWQYTTGKPLNWSNQGWPGTRPVMTTSSTGYMLFDSNGQNGGSNDFEVEKADLISPAIDLSGYDNTKLYFEHFYWHGDTDTATIWLSTDGSNFTEIWRCDDLSCSNGVGSEFGVKDSIDISALADGQSTVYVKFRWVGDYDLFWAVDDIKISGNISTGISENNILNALTIYENPVTTNSLQFSINKPGKIIVSVLDISGKVCSVNSIISSHKNTINIEDLTAGIYLLKITGTEFNGIEKFIKE